MPMTAGNLDLNNKDLLLDSGDGVSRQQKVVL